MRSRKRALPRISTGRLRPPTLEPVREAPARPEGRKDALETEEDSTADSVVVGGITEAAALQSPRPQDSACTSAA